MIPGQQIFGLRNPTDYVDLMPELIYEATGDYFYILFGGRDVALTRVPSWVRPQYIRVVVDADYCVDRRHLRVFGHSHRS
jgi:hypothetical protein